MVVLAASFTSGSLRTTSATTGIIMAKLIRRPVLATFALGQHKCVSTADDECIVHYMQANSQGARHVSVDKDNNVWLSGYGLHYFDLVKGGRWSELGSGQLI